MDSSPYGSEVPKEAVRKRFKLVWRALLISNLALGAYMFAKAGKRTAVTGDNKGVKPRKHETKPSLETQSQSAQALSEVPVVPETRSETTVSQSRTTVLLGTESESTYGPETQSQILFALEEEPMIPDVASQPIRPTEPLDEEQQRELLKWILEEKRMKMPKDSKEKKRNDEDKAVLKRFIQAERVPNIVTEHSKSGRW